MRKIIALILSFTVCFGIFGAFITSADDFTPILRFTVFSDIHIALENDERCEKVANANRVNELNAVNAHYTLNGIHFITISPDIMEPWDHPYSEDKVAWVEKQLEIAENDTGKDKPIFVFQHIGNLSTVIGTKVAVCEQFNDIFNKYPHIK